MNRCQLTIGRLELTEFSVRVRPTSPVTVLKSWPGPAAYCDR